MGTIRTSKLLMGGGKLLVRTLFGISNRLHLSQFLPDDLYISIQFFLRLGYKPDLKHPRTFSEKLQWLKLHNRKPEYTTMVDKYAVKKYVADRIGEEYIIPTLGVWESFDEIDFDSLPDKFVLKCTHDSGGLVICRDKKTLDMDAARKKIEKSLRTDYYKQGREWPYKDVPIRIIAEKFMEDGTQGDALNDYKLMCFDGKVYCSFVCSGRNSEEGLRVTFYDREWKRLPFRRHYPSADKDFDMPLQYHRMIELAERLSKDIPFVRTDFYEIDGKLYFGELTLFPGNGMEEFSPEEWDERLGELIELPNGGGYLIDNEYFTVILRTQHVIDLSDYKFYCFNGEPKFCQVIRDRSTRETIDFYDMDWKHQEFVGLNPVAGNGTYPVERPLHLDKMVEICRELSKGIPFLRVDQYIIDDRVYFGELTFFPAGGMGAFTPNIWNEKLGNMLCLTENINQNTK